MGSLFSGFLTAAAAASDNAFQVSIPPRKSSTGLVTCKLEGTS